MIKTLRQFVKETLNEGNDFFERNFNKIITDLKEKSLKNQLFADHFYVIKNDMHAFNLYIKRIKQLHDNIVVNVLGAGAEGIALHLDNGNVLKIVLDDAVTNASNVNSIAGYKQKRVLKKQGKKTTSDINVYDVGDYHAESEKLIPFINWTSSIKISEGKAMWIFDTAYDWFFEIRRKKYDHDIMHEKYVEANGMKHGWIVLGILDAMKSEFEQGNDDIHIGNLGVRDAGGRYQFIFFDF